MSDEELELSDSRGGTSCAAAEFYMGDVISGDCIKRVVFGLEKITCTAKIVRVSKLSRVGWMG